jgi:hypothetical protein
LLKSVSGGRKQEYSPIIENCYRLGKKLAGIKFTHIFGENPEINQLSQGQLQK